MSKRVILIICVVNKGVKTIRSLTVKRRLDIVLDSY